jgi:hypothetical protein
VDFFEVDVRRREAGFGDAFRDRFRWAATPWRRSSATSASRW